MGGAPAANPAANPANPAAATPPLKTAYQAPPVSGARGEGRSGGRISGFMKKMKEV
jgi:hypothetical protein